MTDSLDELKRKYNWHNTRLTTNLRDHANLYIAALEAALQDKPADPTCAFCNSSNITRHEETDTFIYGDATKGKPAIEVRANVIVTGCIDCGQQWTDGEQEDARTEAIVGALYNEILRMLSPRFQ